MSKQYPGGLITKSPVTPSGPYETSTASGIWTLDQQAYWQKLGQWPTAGNSQFDSQFNYVAMLLHGDGTNGAQNNTFLDGSTNNFTITRNGNTTQGSFSPYGSNWSNNFDGSSALSIGSVTPAQFGSGDWTVEFYVNFSNVSSTQILIAYGYNTSTTRGWQIYKSSGGTVRIAQSPDGSTNYDQSLGSPTLANGVWYHFAVVRNGSTITLYVNGTATGTTATAYSIGTSPTQFKIGVESTNYFSGYFSNIRINKGTAVYTSNFTPSTTPLTAISGTSLLTCQSNRFVDNSTSASAITVFAGAPTVQRFNPFGTATAYDTSVIGGSGYFDSDADSLSIANNTAFDMGSGNFTIEGWFFQAGTGGQICAKYEASNQASWAIGFSGSNWDVYTYYSTTSNLAIYTGVAAPPLNTWNHFALERNSSNIEFYLNGSRVAQVGAQTMRTTTSAVAIGNLGTGYSSYFNGYLSNIRIVKGTAVYSGTTYTVPTAPLTAITNTSLLTNFINGAIFDNAMMTGLETVGNAQISTSVKKYGTGSLAFDGTGDYIVSPLTATPNLNLGGGSYTLEFWVNPTALVNEARMVTIEVPSSTTVGVIMGGGGSGGSNNDVQVNQFGTGTRLNASAVLSTGTWIHVAVTYNGTTSTLWIDGVSKNTYAGSVFPNSNCYVTMGGSVNYSSSTFNGYLDDIRITKGFCRYTTTFTPPTAAFQNLGPT